MTRLWYATTNPAKVVSLQKRLDGHGFEVVQRSLSIAEPRLDRVEDLAIHKASFAFLEIREPVVTLDAGFFVSALNGFPGTFVNFTLERLGIEGLLKLADGTDRRCEFQHALAYHDGQAGTPIYFLDHVRGVIAPRPRGTLRPHHWSPLSTIFIPDGRDKTLAEMDDDEYVHWRDVELPGPNYALQFLNWFERNRSLPSPP